MGSGGGGEGRGVVLVCFGARQTCLGLKWAELDRLQKKKREGDRRLRVVETKQDRGSASKSRRRTNSRLFFSYPSLWDRGKYVLRYRKKDKNGIESKKGQIKDRTTHCIPSIPLCPYLPLCICLVILLSMTICRLSLCSTLIFCPFLNNMPPAILL